MRAIRAELNSPASAVEPEKSAIAVSAEILPESVRTKSEATSSSHCTVCKVEVRPYTYCLNPKCPDFLSTSISLSVCTHGRYPGKANGAEQ
jgi:hypothetical protein